MKVTFEEFAAKFADLSVSELSALVEQETGHRLSSRSKVKALDEAYRLYCDHVAGPSEPPAVLDEDAFDAPPPSVPPAPQPPSQRPTPAMGTPIPELAEPVQYEARSRTGRPFHKMGLVFGVKWSGVGSLTADERAKLDKFAAFVQYRIRG